MRGGLGSSALGLLPRPDSDGRRSTSPEGARRGESLPPVMVRCAPSWARLEPWRRLLIRGRPRFSAAGRGTPPAAPLFSVIHPSHTRDRLLHNSPAADPAGSIKRLARGGAAR